MLRCNQCTNVVDGVAFKTVCHHFFCPHCATNSFQAGNICPCCSQRLVEGDVKEIAVGVPATTTCTDSVFNHTLQDVSWSKISHNMQNAIQSVNEMSQFIQTQLLFQVSEEANQRNILAKDMQGEQLQMVG
jgi:hypothetical protein